LRGAGRHAPQLKSALTVRCEYDFPPVCRPGKTPDVFRLVRQLARFAAGWGQDKEVASADPCTTNRKRPAVGRHGHCPITHAEVSRGCEALLLSGKWRNAVNAL